MCKLGSIAFSKIVVYKVDLFNFLFAHALHTTHALSLHQRFLYELYLYNCFLLASKDQGES